MQQKLSKYAIAVSFCSELQKHLDDEIIKRVVKLNRTEEYRDACASHNFCDPNQIMSDVLESFGHEFDPTLIPIVNGAWSLARNADFQSSKIPKPVTLELATYKREFVGLYETDFTFVVLEHGDNTAIVRPLNFPEREPSQVPWEHLNIFDEIEI